MEQLMKSTPFRWGIIGTGHFAFDIARPVTKSGRHVFVAAYNRTVTKAERFVQTYGGTIYQDIDAMLKDPNIDGIYIATTANSHADFARLAIQAKKPVLVEKPFGINQAQTAQVYQEAKAAGVYLTEAMWTWYNDVATTVKKWLQEKRIGDIQKVKITFGMPIVNFQPNHRLTNANLCGSALMDIGVYPLHYIYELFGEPSSIECDGYVEDGVDYHSKSILHYPNFDVNVGVAMDRFLGERCVIIGSEGKIIVPYFHMAHKAILKTKKERIVFKNPNGRTSDLYVPQFDRVASEIRQGKVASEYVTPTSTIATIGLIDQCRKLLKIFVRNENNEF